MPLLGSMCPGRVNSAGVLGSSVKLKPRPLLELTARVKLAMTGLRWQNWARFVIHNCYA